MLVAFHLICEGLHLSDSYHVEIFFGSSLTFVAILLIGTMKLLL